MRRTLITDWQNPANWTQAQWDRKPDFWSMSTSTTKPPAVGKVLIGTQIGVMRQLSDDVTPAGPFAQELFAIAEKYNANTSASTTVHPDPLVTMIDLSKRGLAKDIAQLFLDHFGSFASGIHFDYWVDLWWLFGNGWTPTGEAPDVYWPKYRAGLSSIAAIIRTAKPDWHFIGQNFHLDGDGIMNSRIDGLYLEQYPTCFRMTLEQHVEQKQQLLQLRKLAGRSADDLWVVELRSPETFAPAYLASLLTWCDDNGFVISYGRGATASVPV